MSTTAEAERFLVVDDDQICAAFLSVAIEHWGLRAEVSLTGKDAMRQLRARSYGGILLDLRLPDIDGLTVLHHLRSDGIQTPVLILTGDGNIPDTVRAMRLGVVDFLEKPLRVAVLNVAIKRMLASSGAAKAVTGVHALSIADAIVFVVRSAFDVPTVQEWCLLIGRSVPSFYALCSLETVSPKDALDLARLLRVLLISDGSDLNTVPSSADPRTSARLLARAGLRPQDWPTSPDWLFESQTFIANESLLTALRVRLRTTLRL